MKDKTILFVMLFMMLSSCEKIDKSGWIIPEPEDVKTDAELVVPDQRHNLSAGKFYLFDQSPSEGFKDMFPVDPWSSGILLTDENASGDGKGCVAWDSETVEVIVDLGKLRQIDMVKLHAVRDIPAAMEYPEKVELCIKKKATDTWTRIEGSMAFADEEGKNGAWGELSFAKTQARYVKYILSSDKKSSLMGIDELIAVGEFSPDLKYVPENGCYHGAFNNNTSFSDNTDPSIVVNHRLCPIDTYEAQVGKQLSMMLWYQGVCDADKQPTRMFGEMQGVRESYSGLDFDGKYRFFLYGWLPDQYTSKQLAEGLLDDYYKSYFKGIADHPEYKDFGPIWFRPANEMNSNWLSYGGDPKNYVRYWRRMYNIAEQYGVTDYNVFVWSPNDVTYNSTTHVTPDAVMKDYWPGEIYVDWIGVSCYPTTLGGYLWPEDLLEEVTSIGKKYGKPMMVSEGAYGKQVQDAKKAQWVTEFFAALKKLEYKAVIWENHATDANGDRRIHKFPDALKAYQEAIRDSYWLDRIPQEVYDEIEKRKGL